MSPQTEPAPKTTIWHITDARARCIAYRVISEILEQLRATGGDAGAVLERLAADQQAADQAWEHTLAAWERQGRESAREHDAWWASVKDRPDKWEVLEQRLRDQRRRFSWPTPSVCRRTWLPYAAVQRTPATDHMCEARTVR